MKRTEEYAIVPRSCATDIEFKNVFQDADLERPPIRVVVADGVEDVTIKEVVFPGQQKQKNLVILGWQDEEMPSAMTGSAYGLPNSQPYACFFGGDLQVISMEGYVTYNEPWFTKGT